jgi:hypothetical protein
MAVIRRIVLAAMTILEEYVEFLVSWFPFYYLFKCLLLGMMLSPQSKVRSLSSHASPDSMKN